MQAVVCRLVSFLRHAKRGPVYAVEIGTAWDSLPTSILSA